jgi:hypothetical protein
MTTIKDLNIFAREMAVKYPALKEEIYDLVQLCMDEIEEGGSTTHELSLCYNDILQLINQ